MKNRSHLYVVVATLLMSCALSACRTQQQSLTETFRTDTVTIVKDSVIIKEKIVPVEVPVPVVEIERVVPEDTTSVINTGLYTSTASVKDGLLFHTLKTNPDAKISANVQVADTTHIQDSSVSVTNDHEKIVEKIKEVNVLTASQNFFVVVGKGACAVVLGAILFIFCRFYLKKRGVLK
jgi:hypothetical protein